MRTSSLLLLFVLTSPAAGQVLKGDLLLNSFATPDMLVHYRPDGTVVQTTQPGTGTSWEGAAILPNGNWVTTSRNPTAVNIFDPVTGVEIASWNLTGFVGVPADVGVFTDGTIAVVEQGARVWRFDTAGNFITNWKVTKNPFGILVDDLDHVWTCDATNGVLWHTDGLGKKLGEFSVGSAAGDATMAQDGTLFVTLRNKGEVVHFAQDGTFLGSFVATGTSLTSAIAMAPDQTLWVTGSLETKLFHYDQAGVLLGSFDVSPAALPLFLTIPLFDGKDIGTTYCGPAIPNSSGQPATISAFGSTLTSENFVKLVARQLPLNVFGYFLNSDVQGFTPLPPGSQGNLCLAGAIGRHAKQVGSTGAAGTLAIGIDLTALPRPNGTHSVLAGETWNFQCWFRDNNGGPTSNFTDGIEIVFQ